MKNKNLILENFIRKEVKKIINKINENYSLLENSEFFSFLIPKNESEEKLILHFKQWIENNALDVKIKMVDMAIAAEGFTISGFIYLNKAIFGDSWYKNIYNYT